MFIQNGGLPPTARLPGTFIGPSEVWTLAFSLVQGIVTGNFVSRGAHWTDHCSCVTPCLRLRDTKLSALSACVPGLILRMMVG
jgi:hypothetical protein